MTNFYTNPAAIRIYENKIKNMAATNFFRIDFFSVFAWPIELFSAFHLFFGWAIECNE